MANNNIDISRITKELKPFLLMVLCQVVGGVVNIFYKLATVDGMHVKILIVYRLLFATAFTVPLALVFERKIRPRMTWMVALQGFLCGLFGGALGNNLYAEGVVFTSATFASSISNLMSAITFILAIIFRLERLAIQTSAGKAKVVGTVLGITGAMVLTLYKGLKINIWSTHTNVLNHHDVAASQRASNYSVWGPFMCIGSCLCFAIWLIIQTKMNERYPLYTSIALMNTSGAIQAGVYAMCTEKNWSAWKLGWDIRLLSAAYCGTAGSVFLAAAMSWCSQIKGPLYVASFYPLGLIFVAFVGSLFLDEKLHLGSVAGSVLIIAGLYTVLWGKREELKMTKSAIPVRSSEESIETSVSNGDQGKCSAIIQITTAGKSDEAFAAMEAAKIVTS